MQTFIVGFNAQTNYKYIDESGWIQEDNSIFGRTIIIGTKKTALPVLVKLQIGAYGVINPSFFHIKGSVYRIVPSERYVDKLEYMFLCLKNEYDKVIPGTEWGPYEIKEVLGVLENSIKFRKLFGN